MSDCVGAALPSVEPAVEEGFRTVREQVLKGGQQNVQFLGFGEKGIDRLQFLSGRGP